MVGHSGNVFANRFSNGVGNLLGGGDETGVSGSFGIGVGGLLLDGGELFDTFCSEMGGSKQKKKPFELC